MKRLKLFNPVARAIAVIASVSALATGVTFAALNNQVTLADNSILTTSAGLQIYNFDQNQWSNTAPGFVITDLVPGTGVTEHFYLQNTGGAPLDVTAHVPQLPPPPTGGDYGFSGFSNVTVEITGESCGDTVTTDLSALNAGEVALPCNPLGADATGNSNVPGTEGNYAIKFDINPAAITGSQAGVGNFDIVFTGTQAAPAPAPTPNPGT